MGIMNHKYGNVANDAKIPARIMIHVLIRSCLKITLHKINKTMVSTDIVTRSDFKKSIS